MVARYIGTIHRQHAQRILFAQIRLGGEGKSLQIIQGMDLFGRHARFGKGLRVEWNTLDPLDGLLQLRALQCCELITRQRLFLIPNAIFDNKLAHIQSMLVNDFLQKIAKVAKKMKFTSVGAPSRSLRTSLRSRSSAFRALV